MRVLMVSDVYLPRVNGVSTSIETFRLALHAHGVEINLVAPAYDGTSSQPGITRVRGWPVPGDPEDRLVGWRAMHKAVLAAARHCDLIHIQTPFVAHYAGLQAARQLGLPVLATYHTLFEEYLQHYVPFLPATWLKKQARAFSRRQCNALDAVIVPSTAMRERLDGYGVTSPLHVLPTGIPLHCFAEGNRQAFRDKHGISASRPLALFVGRVAHEKNIGFLFEALLHARLQRPDLLLLIAGEGPATSDLKNQVKALNLGEQVKFIGYLDRQQELPNCYAAADVFVFASQTETQGLVLLEAMAAGLPVISLAEMGTLDILAPRRGALISPADTRRFAEILVNFLDQPASWQALSKEALAYAHEWSDTAMAGRLAKLYGQLLPRED